MRNITFFLIVLAVISGFPLSAQESEQTIEQLYLQNAIKTQIIKTEATSLDREIKMVALESIEEMINANEANPEIAEILRELSGEGVTSIIREEGVVINDFPEIRRESARLLGELGTQEAADSLQTILLTDTEPMVLSEAIISISKIDVQDTVMRDRALAEIIYRQSAVNKDNNFAIAYLEAVENIIVREGKIGNIAIIEEVAKLADARQGYINQVRQRAFKLLRDLKKF